MNLFYTSHIEGKFAFLDEEESRHIVKSLRKRPGDLLEIVDGRGNLFKARLIETGKKGCKAEIETEEYGLGEVIENIHIAISPVKNAARFEWFLEKATEIGVSRITPLLCKRTEKQYIKRSRWEKILISSMKQSLRAFLPELSEPQPIDSFIPGNKDVDCQKLIAHCEEITKKKLNESYKPKSDIILLIGPEGDFTNEEIEMAIKAGYIPISLGASRLRTETAGVYGLSVISSMNA